jgi:hypothetical protein
MQVREQKKKGEVTLTIEEPAAMHHGGPLARSIPEKPAKVRIIEITTDKVCFTNRYQADRLVCYLENSEIFGKMA